MNGYNDKRMHPAANEKTFRLPETRVWASNFGAHPFISASAWLSSTLQWGCDYSCDRTASGKLDQRFYNSVYGRFMSADRYKRNAKASNSGSWNKYSYTQNDPVNKFDPHGAVECGPDDDPDECEPDDPCANGCNAPPPPPPPPVGGPPVLPSCSITLFTRGVPVGGSPANHTYIEITDSATNTDEVLEGGPTNPHNPFKQRGASWGNLLGDISGDPGSLGDPIGNRLRGTDPARNQKIGSETGGIGVCAEALAIDADVRNYDKGPLSSYAPVPNGSTTFNSNSFTFTLLSQIGLAAVFQPYIGWSPGWGFLVPGL
jgi:RHS repeat-associated protein